jgi:membrane protease YdiL (CAAX protease family)
LFFLWSAYKDNFNLWRNGWRPVNNVFIEVGGGVAMGLVMAILYFAFVAPYQTILQTQFGDYVETGETAVKLVQQPIVFFIVNVAIAPILGESLFRNYAIKQLSPQFSMPVRIIITSAAFGLLHCLAGFWFMLMTGILVGIPFAYVAEKRKNIIWTFAAHTTLNILEVIYFAY